MDSAERMQFIQSGTRGPIYKEAVKLSESGEKVLKLNTGNPAAFGFSMPESLKKVLLQATEDSRAAAAYSESAGMKKAKEAILRYDISRGIGALSDGTIGIDTDDIFIGNGVSELAELTALALFNPGDEVLLPSPNYNLWSNSVILAGAKPVFYECHEDNSWMPDSKEIEALVNENTRAIVVINPNNPTGMLYTNELLLEICDVAKRKNLLVISDEIYDRILMDGAVHTPVSKLAPELPVITYNGLSKSHIVCGLRCGWMTLSGDFNNASYRRVVDDMYEGGIAIKSDAANSGDFHSPIHKAIDTLMSVRLCGNTIAQLCIEAALDDPVYTEQMLEKGGRIYEQREACINAINESECLSVVKNVGALYCFVQIRPDKCKITDDKKWAMQLVKEKHIMVVPGSGFDYKKPNYFRIVMLPYPDDLAKAVRDIDDFCKTYVE